MCAWLSRREKDERRLCILTYHRILEIADPLLDSEPDINTFRWQMELLANCFNVLPLHDAISALAAGSLPPRAVCITFDDGYRSIHDLALPVLKELDLPATVFVTTGHMESGNMWNDKIIEALRRMPDGELDLRKHGLNTYTLGKVDERKHVLHALIEKSKYLPSNARTVLVQELSELDKNVKAPSLMLTRQMVAKLAEEGIEIGGHTINHPILTRMDDDQARHEISACKQQLEEITGKPVRFFAYPNGKVGVDFDARHAQMVKEAGYAGAFTTAIGAATKEHDPDQMPRSRPWDKSQFMYALRLLRWLESRTT